MTIILFVSRGQIKYLSQIKSYALVPQFVALNQGIIEARETPF